MVESPDWVSHWQVPLPVADWPQHFAAVLKDRPSQLQQLSLLLKRGCMVHTDFSGKRCPESAFLLLLDGMRAEGVRWKRNAFQFWRCSDVDPDCQSLAHSSKFPPVHIYGAVQTRMPVHAQQRLEELRPASKESGDSRRERYQQQQRLIENDLSRHLGTAPVTCLKAAHAECRCLPTYSDSLTPSDSRRPLTMCVAGAMCTPFSTFGKKEGMGSEHVESMNIWLADMQQGQMDLVTLENVPRFPKTLFAERMGPGYGLVGCVFCPTDLAGRHDAAGSGRLLSDMMYLFGPALILMMKQQSTRALQTCSSSLVSVQQTSGHMIGKATLRSARTSQDSGACC